MPRDLPLSNGRLLVNFDSDYNLRDIFFPYVGHANHAYGRRSRLGFWVDGSFSWLDSHEWQLDARFSEDTQVTHVVATNAALGIAVTIEDTVDFHLNVLIRRLIVSNTHTEARDIRVFFHLDFSLWGTAVGDTAFYHPEHKAIIAYQDQCYLLLNTSTEDSRGLSSWTMAHKDNDEGTGCWQKAQSGVLDGTPVAFGSVDCVGALHLDQVQAGESRRADCWIAVGESLDDVLALDNQIADRGPARLLKRTSDYWRAWARNELDKESPLRYLPQPFQQMYTRGLLVIRAHTDHEGGIIAAGDSEVSMPYDFHGQLRDTPIVDPFHGHEHYSYVWPRDAALTALALVRAGYSGLSRQLLRFCDRVITYDAARDWSYMLQKYNPNGSVASNYIPWIDEYGNPRLPVQEDESALVLYVLWEHFQKYHDWELITPLYRTFVKTIGNFLLGYRDRSTGLPLPCQDVWEERDGVHAFTLATIHAGLRAAAWFTQLFGEHGLASEFSQAADDVKKATELHLYDEGEGRFLRTVRTGPNGQLEPDTVVDASLFGLFYFNMFDVLDPRIQRTMDAVIQRLNVPAQCGGIARYEGDTYQKRALGDGLPGNPWLICTLWVAQYHVRKARKLDELEPARRIIEWVREHSLPSGVLGEQLDPNTGDPVGASPLTWSHSTLVLTIIEYAERYRELAKR